MIRAMPMIPPVAWRAIQFGFTALLAILLWTAADGPEVLHILSGAQPLWLVCAVLFLIGQTILSAVRWKITAAQLGQTLPIRRAIAEYFLSQTINQAIPGAIVGDAARAVRTKGEAGLAVSAQAVVFERLAGQLAMFITMCVSFFVTVPLDGGLYWPTTFAVSITTAILITIIVICALAVGAWQFGFMASWMQLFYRAVFSGQVIGKHITLGAAITFCNLAAFVICAWAVGVTLSFAAVTAIVPVILFSMLIPFTISGWGVREGAAAALLPLAGTSTSEAVAISIMFGVALLIAVLPGLIVAGTK